MLYAAERSGEVTLEVGIATCLILQSWPSLQKATFHIYCSYLTLSGPLPKIFSSMPHRQAMSASARAEEKVFRVCHVCWYAFYQ